MNMGQWWRVNQQPHTRHHDSERLVDRGREIRTLRQANPKLAGFGRCMQLACSRMWAWTWGRTQGRHPSTGYGSLAQSAQEPLGRSSPFIDATAVRKWHPNNSRILNPKSLSALAVEHTRLLKVGDNVECLCPSAILR